MDEVTKAMSENAKAVNQNTALLEVIHGQNDAILAGQKDQATRADSARIERRLEGLESDMQVVKATVTDMSRDLEAHKK